MGNVCTYEKKRMDVNLDKIDKNISFYRRMKICIRRKTKSTHLLYLHNCFDITITLSLQCINIYVAQQKNKNTVHIINA